jgi:hypothetical protein
MTLINVFMLVYLVELKLRPTLLFSGRRRTATREDLRAPDHRPRNDALLGGLPSVVRRPWSVVIEAMHLPPATWARDVLPPPALWSCRAERQRSRDTPTDTTNTTGNAGSVEVSPRRSCQAQGGVSTPLEATCLRDFEFA